MKQLALALALSGSALLGTTTLATTAHALETYEARVEATIASTNARNDMINTFGVGELTPGKYLWRADVPESAGEQRVVVSLGDQMAYLYRGDHLVAVSTISSGKPGHDTPAGIFPILGKAKEYYSKKYDNAPMPYMQRLDNYGIALHAGNLPGRPASHGCVRLPMEFARKLFSVTEVGTEVYIGA